jgi:hypothetical protein
MPHGIANFGIGTPALSRNMMCAQASRRRIHD